MSAGLLEVAQAPAPLPGRGLLSSVCSRSREKAKLERERFRSELEQEKLKTETSLERETGFS